MAPLFMGDDDELQGLIKDHMILPYLFGDFHPSHIQEYAGCLLIPLEKTCQRRWGYPPHHLRRKLASLFCQPCRQRCPGSYVRIFTSTYENFLQTAGLQDGASHCAKILSAMYAALNSDPSDPDVIILFLKWLSMKKTDPHGAPRRDIRSPWRQLLSLPLPCHVH